MMSEWFLYDASLQSLAAVQFMESGPQNDQVKVKENKCHMWQFSYVIMACEQ